MFRIENHISDGELQKIYQRVLKGQRKPRNRTRHLVVALILLVVIVIIGVLRNMLVVMLLITSPVILFNVIASRRKTARYARADFSQLSAHTRVKFPFLDTPHELIINHDGINYVGGDNAQHSLFNWQFFSGVMIYRQYLVLTTTDALNEVALVLPIKLSNTLQDYSQNDVCDFIQHQIADAERRQTVVFDAVDQSPYHNITAMTIDEYHRVFKLFYDILRYDKSAFLRQKLRTTLTFGLPIIFLLSGLLFVLSRGEMALFATGYFRLLSLLVLISAFAIAYQADKFIFGNAVKAIANPDNREKYHQALTERRFLFEREGVVIHTEQGEFQHSYHGFKHVVRYDEGYVIVNDRGNMVLLKRGFVADSEHLLLQRLAENHIELINHIV